MLRDNNNNDNRRRRSFVLFFSHKTARFSLFFRLRENNSSKKKRGRNRLQTTLCGAGDYAGNRKRNKKGDGGERFILCINVTIVTATTIITWQTMFCLCIARLLEVLCVYERTKYID